MALAESSAAAVLAAEADRSAFQYEAPEGERFRRRPVDGSAAENFATLLKKSFEFRMDVEIRRERGDGFHHSLQRGTVHGGIGTGLDHVLGNDCAELLYLVLFVALFGSVVKFVHPLREALANLLGLSQIDDTFAI